MSLLERFLRPWSIEDHDGPEAPTAALRVQDRSFGLGLAMGLIGLAAVARFATLVKEALAPEKERIPVPVPRAAKERRLEEKRHRGRVKRERALDPGDDD